jgi:hypothetical protein
MRSVAAEEDARMVKGLIKMMQVGFYYPFAHRGMSAPGIHVSLNVDEQAESQALQIAEDGVCKALEDAGIRYIHAYSYPDGSLYKYVEVTGTEDETWEKLCALPVWRLGPVRPVERYTNERSTPEEQERLAGLWQHKYGA